MKKSNFVILFNGLIGLSTALMVWGLFSSVLPRYSEHGPSLMTGTAAYISLVIVAWFLKENSSALSTLLPVLGIGLTGTHIYAEIQLISSIGFSTVTHLLGYTALMALGFAVCIKVLSRLSKSALASLTLNGFLTTGVAFTYWHVSSITIIRESNLFFIPFSFLFILTVGQLLFKVYRERNHAYSSPEL